MDAGMSMYHLLLVIHPLFWMCAWIPGHHIRLFSVLVLVFFLLAIPFLFFFLFFFVFSVPLGAIMICLFVSG